MTPSFHRLGRILTLLCLGLVGCTVSTERDRNGQQLMPPVPGIDTSAAQRLIASGAPRLRITLLDEGPSVLMVETDSSEGVTRWRTIDNAQVFLRDGLLIGTRGLSFDLMTADVAEASAAIHQMRAARVTRIHNYLNGQDKLRIRAFLCDVRPAGQETIKLLNDVAILGQRVDETCHGAADDEFTNQYWLGGGRILQSVQFISEGAGRAQILFPGP